MVDISADAIAAAALELYSSLWFNPPAGQYTILAAFILSHREAFKAISLATGSKCLPMIRFPREGDALHDSHAEVLARRGAIRWLLEEVQRISLVGDYESAWIGKAADGKFRFKENVKMHVYISTVPCGDASTRFLASFQDAEMAALKSGTQFPELTPRTASRGRDNYSLYGVLRTKPGRADSPRTLCMSCSDKIARWNVLGIQGALASYFFHPIYISTVIIGEVELRMQDMVTEDCRRALWQRLSDLNPEQLPPGYKLNQPAVLFTSLPFAHSKVTLNSSTSCNDSLCWIADCQKPHEVLINGFKRGIPPKHRDNPKFRPQLCKKSLLFLYYQTVDQIRLPSHPLTYHELKRTATEYQTAKLVLQDNGPFAGWVISGIEWEDFALDSPPRE